MEYSRKTNSKYIVWNEGDQQVTKLPKGLTDKTLNKMSKQLTDLINTLTEARDIEEFLDAEVFPWNLDPDTLISNAHDMLENIREVQTTLATHNDNEIESDTIDDLVGLGYKRDIYSRPSEGYVIFEKTIEDTEYTEVVDEIIVFQKNRDVKRRKRTIIWEKTESGRQSKSIIYQKLKIGVRLGRAIDITRKREFECKNQS